MLLRKLKSLARIFKKPAMFKWRNYGRPISGRISTSAFSINPDILGKLKQIGSDLLPRLKAWASLYLRKPTW